MQGRHYARIYTSKGHCWCGITKWHINYEAVKQLNRLGIGQSTCLGIGGDPLLHTIIDAIKLFNEDTNTTAILMIGEIGGNAEELAAEYVKQNVKKPVIGLLLVGLLLREEEWVMRAHHFRRKRNSSR